MWDSGLPEEDVGIIIRNNLHNTPKEINKIILNETIHAWKSKGKGDNIGIILNKITMAT